MDAVVLSRNAFKCFYPLSAIIGGYENIFIASPCCCRRKGSNKIQAPFLEWIQWRNRLVRHSCERRRLSYSLAHITLSAVLIHIFRVVGQHRPICHIFWSWHRLRNVLQPYHNEPPAEWLPFHPGVFCITISHCRPCDKVML